MIKIDGQQCEKNISDFANLEQLLVGIMQAENMSGRIVTDIFVNEQPFSEIYPHQAEDMSCDNIQSVEIRTEPAKKLAVDVAAELDKVARMMISGAHNVARLFREAKNNDALELLQDLLDVTRDFMGMLAHLKDHYLGGADQDFVQKTEKLADLVTEMSDVLEDEDWILLGDLLEFEFVPMCEEWRQISDKLHKQLEACAK